MKGVKDKDYKSMLNGMLPVVKSAAEFIKLHFAGVQAEDIIEKSINSLVSFVDKTSEKMLIDGLTPLIENVGFITEEEMTKQEIRDYTWIIDPLDETTNFLNEVPYFSISIALYDGKDIVLGLVHDVMHNESYTAIRGEGAWCNNKPIQVSSKTTFQDILVGTGFTYKPERLQEGHLSAMREVLLKTRGIRRIGSAALDLCYVARGRFGAFYENSLNAYNIAAGALIVREAGGIVSDFKGGNNWLFEGEILATAPQFRNDLLKVTSHFNT